MNRRLALVAALFAAVRGLTACGNGGGGNAPSATPPSAEPPPAPAPAPGPEPPPSPAAFPLQVSSNKRYLVDANGQAFLIHGDSPWAAEVQLTRAQIDIYLDDRQSKGFTAILFECMEHLFSSQTPPWTNAQSSAAPFTTTTAANCSFASTVETYWQTVDYIVDGARSRGMVCLITPAYLGFGGGTGAPGDQGWNGAVQNATAADLQAYGAWLARRYQSRGNIIWVMGGDYAGTASERTQQWNIATGILSVTPSALITGHAARTQSAYSQWAGYAGFNLNTIYTEGTEYGYAAAEYARPGPLPFFLVEAIYDGEGATPADCRRQAYATVLSGGCGHFFGNNPIWGFGEPVANHGAGAGASLNSLSTVATVQMQYVKQLFAAYAWWKLEPQTGTRLVTTGLGSGKSRICPALAGDGSFAMVWSTGGPFTANLAALAPPKIRARWYDTTSGKYSTATDAALANTSTQEFVPPGECVLVLDAA